MSTQNLRNETKRSSLKENTLPQKSLDAVAKTFTKQLLKKRNHLERNSDYNQDVETKTNRF